ncbi:hypothetical protein, partial [Pseudomonas brassicae]|uniref:hypothetical protein n=1 Tax=Pseudomonas brassicae TaxID=2708063 RepID=UPI001FB1A544
MSHYINIFATFASRPLVFFKLGICRAVSCFEKTRDVTLPPCSGLAIKSDSAFPGPVRQQR